MITLRITDSDTPVHEKELAVSALGGCVSVLKEYMVDQQILSQGQFQTCVPPELASNDQSLSRTKFATNMVYLLIYDRFL